MQYFDSMDTVQEINVLVGFFDLTKFLRFADRHTDQEVFSVLDTYYEFVGDLIEEAGGRIIKFMGDAGLIVFAETDVDQGVLALKRLLVQGDAWLAERGMTSRHIVKAHFGPVVAGPIGTKREKRFDVLGKTVNTAVRLKSNGLAITPQVLRKLDAKIRQQFKKHTPPITYIPITEPHID